MEENPNDPNDIRHMYIANYLSDMKKENPLSFEPFANVVIAKNILKGRYSADYADCDRLGDMILSTMPAFMSKTFESVQCDSIIHKTIDFKGTIDCLLGETMDDVIDEQMHSFKYLFIGNNRADDTNFINIAETDELFYIGDYQSLKVYHIPYMTDSYLISGPIMDINSLSFTYNDTLDCDIEDGESFKGHKMYVSYNTVLGNVRVIKFE